MSDIPPATDIETTEVVICGCGPTGALLSANLGQRGIRNIVLERELDITQDPRGIALDEDGIRLLQGVGIYENVFKDIGQSKTSSFIQRLSNIHIQYRNGLLQFHIRCQ